MALLLLRFIIISIKNKNNLTCLQFDFVICNTRKDVPTFLSSSFGEFHFKAFLWIFSFSNLKLNENTFECNCARVVEDINSQR